MTKRIVRQFFIVFLVILIGTGLDWLVHQTSPAYAVPSWYFRNKIIFGTLLGCAAFLLARRYARDYRWQAFWTALIVAVLLQFRYLLLGYSAEFLLLFLGVHFVAFLIPAWFLFRYLPHR